MSNPARNPQHRRGHNWFAEERKQPPPDDARQRHPEVQQGAASIANTKPEEGLNIARQRASRTADKPLGTQKYAGGVGHSKSTPRGKRRQPNFERVVKIARRFLDPRPRP